MHKYNSYNWKRNIIINTEKYNNKIKENFNKFLNIIFILIKCILIDNNNINLN